MNKTKLFFTIKKYGYFVFLIPILLPVTAIWLSQKIPAATNFLTYLSFMLVFFVFPILDYIIGKDPVNPSKEDQAALDNQIYYRLLTISCVPLLTGLLIYATYYFTHNPDLNIWGKIGWILSIGIATGGIGITVGHELIHKDTKYERAAGGILLALVCYTTFKVEHIRGHHMWVATEVDSSSSKLNQTLYSFLIQAISRNFLGGWKLEAARLRKKSLSPWSFHNELIIWYSLSTLFALGLTLSMGFMALVFFLSQSLVAILLLEIVNYIEHYGLNRSKQDDGHYTRLTIMHSWNSNYLLSNWVLFQLQRHSDHHSIAKRRYQSLQHQEQSPQLPGGYPSMILLALIPPLWFKIINPKIPAASRT